MHQSQVQMCLSRPLPNPIYLFHQACPWKRSGILKQVTKYHVRVHRLAIYSGVMLSPLVYPNYHKKHLVMSFRLRTTDAVGVWWFVMTTHTKLIITFWIFTWYLTFFMLHVVIFIWIALFNIYAFKFQGIHTISYCTYLILKLMHHKVWNHQLNSKKPMENRWPEHETFSVNSKTIINSGLKD